MPPAPKATELESVPVNVSVLLTVNVLLAARESVEPSPRVSVEPVAGAVSVTLLTVVAEATPSTGVTRVGVVARTISPVPVVELPRAVTVPLVGSVSDVVPEVVRVVA